jgi:chemotaxis protein CheD
MHSAAHGEKEIYVQPGEAHLVCEPAHLRTILGSCVGITFWEPRGKIAALCHPTMPELPKNTDPLADPAGARRYVDFAIREMALRFYSLGIARSRIEVKLFGGADVLAKEAFFGRPTMGELNCKVALRVVAEEGLRVVASSLRGTDGISISFLSGTGEVRLRRLRLAG